MAAAVDLRPRAVACAVLSIVGPDAGRPLGVVHVGGCDVGVVDGGAHVGEGLLGVLECRDCRFDGGRRVAVAAVVVDAEVAGVEVSPERAIDLTQRLRQPAGQGGDLHEYLQRKEQRS